MSVNDTIVVVAMTKREKTIKARELLAELDSLPIDVMHDPEDMTDSELDTLVQAMTLMVSTAKAVYERMKASR